MSHAPVVPGAIAGSAAGRAKPSLAHASRTRERLLAAAAEVFATRGYRGATMREIADRARANLASAHYHFGSKENLYLEVSSRQFEEIERRLGEDAHLPAQRDGKRERAALERMLERRVYALLALLLDPSNRHGALVQRELSDPSEALRLVVTRFVEPLRTEMNRLVAALAPGLSREQIDRCTRSIVAQIYFYVSHRAVLLQLMARQSYPRGFARSIAEHICRFSLGGIGAVSAAAAQRHEVRGRARRRRGLQ